MTVNSGLFGRFCAFFCVCILSFAARAETVDIPGTSELVFATNFTNTYFADSSGNTVAQAYRNLFLVKGDDTTLAGNGYRTNWDALKTLTGSVINTNQSGSTASDAYAAIIDDPFGTGRGKILHFRSTMTGGKTRGQLNTDTTLNKWTSVIKMRVPSISVGLLASYPSAMDWFTVVEMPIAPDFGASFTDCNSGVEPAPLYLQNVNCVPNFRTGLDIVKSGSNLVWQVYSDYAGKMYSDAEKAARGLSGRPTNGLTQTEYIGQNSTQTVPLDQWFDLIFYYERYANRTDGRGRIKVQVKNSSNVVTTIFDLSDVVVTDPLNASRRYGRIKLNPAKMYTAAYFVQHIFDNNGADPDTVDMYYDNWRFYSGDATLPDGAQSTIKYPKKPDTLTVAQSGANINISWTAPTLYTDETAIGGGEITGYDVRTGASNGGGATFTKLIDNQAGLTASVTPGSDGRYCYQARARTATASGYWSDEQCVNFTIGTPAGADPVLVSVTQNQATGSLTSLGITLGGAIPEGNLILVCHVSQRGEDLTVSTSGWTTVGQVIGTHGLGVARDPNLKCVRRLAGASEPTTYTISTDGTALERLFGFVAHFSNPSGAPIADVKTVIADQATSATIPAVSGGTANALALAVTAVWDNGATPPTATAPSGYTHDVNVSNSIGNRFGVLTVSHKTATDGTLPTASTSTTEASNFVSMHILVNGQTTDSQPDQFSFTPVTNATAGGVYTSCIPAITGMPGSSQIFINPPQLVQFNKNGGAYQSDAAVSVTNGDTVCLRASAPDNEGETFVATLTIGGVFADWAITVPVVPKKIVFDGANKLTCRSAASGSATEFDGVMSIVIGDGNPRIQPGQQFPTILAYDTEANVVDGVFTLNQAQLDYGTINGLLTGSQGYYMWGRSSDGACRWSSPIEVVLE